MKRITIAGWLSDLPSIFIQYGIKDFLSLFIKKAASVEAAF
jgi:hypothetical protein